MAFEPGDVVFLKSGGQPMTVATVDEDRVECLWLGEEGELFRETIPSAVLTAAFAAESLDSLPAFDHIRHFLISAPQSVWSGPGHSST